jgi:hypothetical protein
VTLDFEQKPLGNDKIQRTKIYAQQPIDHSGFSPRDEGSGVLRLRVRPLNEAGYVLRGDVSFTIRHGKDYYERHLDFFLDT